MTDISIFKKMLDHKPPYSTARGYVYLSAHEVRPGQFAYHVGFKSWPISMLFTFDLAAAREAAASFGVPVVEVGPLQAFGRRPPPGQSSQ
jgi:hypothetical protein